jgi:hypothetical protein
LDAIYRVGALVRDILHPGHPSGLETQPQYG